MKCVPLASAAVVELRMPSCHLFADFEKEGCMQVILEAYQGALPNDYVVVHRWASSNEVGLWRRDSTHIPSSIGGAGRVYVTLPGAPRPGGTGPFRVEFAVPSRMLQAGSKPEEKQIFEPVQNTPILNLRIVLPS
jgi:hypothetical protein